MGSSASWPMRILRPGRAAISANLTADRSRGGSQTIDAGGVSVKCSVVHAECPSPACPSHYNR